MNNLHVLRVFGLHHGLAGLQAAFAVGRLRINESDLNCARRGPDRIIRF